MPELAKAYVQIVPSAQGIKGKLEDLLGGEADSAGASAGGRFSGAFGSVMGTVGKAVGAGLAAAAGAAGAVAKQAVSSYADFEQLSGGIETMFGESADAVMRNADRAFQSAGLSANAYMETAIQSSAALINSLGGDTSEAARLMDVSITDMADNVNKMGTTMESVQNAYRGFSRGNFTMLDNLALGFAGTKEGMQQLLDKAQELSGIKYDISSYSDIVNAIHVVQTEMGITGTTAKEAAETISGSLSSMKASWANLLTGIANGDADISSLTAQFTGSLTTVVSNLKPVIKTALSGLAEVVRELAPEIAVELPGLVADLAPSLVEAAVGIAVALGTGLAENAPEIISSLLTAIVSNAPALLEGGVQLVISLAAGLLQAIPEIITAAFQLVATLLQEVGKGVVQLVTVGGELLHGLWQGISGAASWLWQQVSGWLSGLWNGIKSFFGVASPSTQMAGLGGDLLRGLWQGISGAADWLWQQVSGWLSGLWNGIKSFFGIASPSTEMASVGDNLVRGLWSGISGAAGWLWQQVSGWLSGLLNGIKGFFGIASPSKKMAWAGEMLAEGLANGISAGADDAITAAARMNAAVLGAMHNDGISAGGSFRGGAKAAQGDGAAGPEALAAAIQAALDGCGVYMDGALLGRLVTRYQARTARAAG